MIYTLKNWSLETVFNNQNVRLNNINFTYSHAYAETYISNLIAGFPSPNFVIVEHNDGGWTVISNLKHFDIINKFFNGFFTVSGLKYNELPIQTRRKINELVIPIQLVQEWRLENITLDELALQYV